jgi:type I restriction enzyme S subunit
MIWKKTNLEQVCQILDSKRIPITKKDRVEGDIPYFGATGILSFVNDFIFNEPLVLLGEDGAKWGAGENSAFKIDGKTWVNNHAHVLKPNREILLDDWLVYWLNFQNLNTFVSGATVPKLNQRNMKQIPVLLPPIEIQRDLVSKLDQAFEAIDQAIENTKKNIENVDELFQSQLDFLFSSKDDSWSTNSLSEIATLKYGYTEKSSDTGHYRYIRITDIDKQGKLRNETKQYLAYSLEAEEYLLKHNDLLMARTGATYGKVLLYDNIEPSVYASYLIRIDFNIPLDNEVYWFFSKSKSYWKQASQLSSGSAQPQFNGNALKKVSFSYPRHKDDQDILKEKCRAIFESTENLKQQYTAKLNELESLKMSILEKAFKGELI